LSLVQKLEELPGVGPYTARAVAAFAFNQDVIMVETNIRTAIIHHFFPDTEKTVQHRVLDKMLAKRKISDTEIEKVLVQVLPKGKSREWYYALMGYGTYLKRSGISYNIRGTRYAKQTKFIGSMREARGAILRALARGSLREPRLLALLDSSRRPQLRAALAALQKEGLIKKNKGKYVLP